MLTRQRPSLDLNGFSIRGPTACSIVGCSPLGTGIGIEDGSGTFNTRVRNGQVTGMGSDGLSLNGRNYVRGVVPMSNGGAGISVGARSSVIECQAQFNDGAGIRIDENTGLGIAGNAGQNLLQGNLSVVNGVVDAAAWDIEGSRGAGGNICEDGSCSARGARRYFLIDFSVTATGGEAASACTGGYHMAAMFELLHGSNLEYTTKPQKNVAVVTGSDVGTGPRQGISGWVRTGLSDQSTGDLGFGN